MTKLATIAATAAMALALLMPIYAHAKAQGDTIGAPMKPVMTGTSRADMADAPAQPTYTTTVAVKDAAIAAATTTPTRAQQHAQIKKLMAEVARLEKLLKSLSK